MDFITSIPNFEGNNVTMVVVDQLTKNANFLSLYYPFKSSTIAIKFVEID
jgi:hypothetical protein